MSIEKKAHFINSWLRYHSDYQVTIEFLSLYGTIEIKITRKGDYVRMWIGDTLEKRLDEVIAYLRTI